MPITDFLFNGAAPPSTTSYGTTSSSMPAWYSDYTQGLISKANAIASTPYSAYTAPRLASLQSGQTGAWEGIKDLQRGYQPGFDQSGAQISGAYAPAYQQTQIAGNQTALGQNAQAQGAFNQALGSDISNQYAQAGSLASDSARNPAYAATQPYLAQQQQYLNPIYQNMERLSAERLGNQESNIRDQFVRSGQYGGSRQSGALNAARRSSLADLAGQQQSFAQQGYNAALGAGQADLNRGLQGSQILGGLAGAQQTNAANIGNQLAQLSAADISRRLSSAGQLGQLGTSALAGGLESNKFLEGTGKAQQIQSQQQLDLAHQDYLQQLQHPYQQVSFLNNAIRGLSIPTTQSSSQTGASAVYQPSPISAITGGALGISALGRAFN